jgi:hypothetical protein
MHRFRPGRKGKPFARTKCDLAERETAGFSVAGREPAKAVSGLSAGTRDTEDAIAARERLTAVTGRGRPFALGQAPPGR